MTRTDANRISLALCAGNGRKECADCLHLRTHYPHQWSDIPDYDPATLDRVSGDVCKAWGFHRG